MSTDKVSGYNQQISIRWDPGENPVQPVLFGPVTTMLKINILALYFLKHAHSGTISLHKWNIKKHKSKESIMTWTHISLTDTCECFEISWWVFQGSEDQKSRSCTLNLHATGTAGSHLNPQPQRLACQGVPNEADGFNNSLQLDYDFTMRRGLKATLITEHDKVLKQKCWVLCKLADNFVNSTWVSDLTLFIVSSVTSSFDI